MKISLIRASVGDIQKFIDIEKSVAGLKTYSAMTSEKEARKEFEKCEIYFIEKDGETVGSVEYEMKSRDHAYISGLVIRPQFEGRGIGRGAVSQVLEKLKEVKTITLVTHPDNRRAVSLYTSLGFTIGERKENYFGDGEPRIVLSLTK